jgi:hypothetical protein
MKTTHTEAQQWWSNLSTGERRLICAIARMLKGANPTHSRGGAPVSLSPRERAGVRGKGSSANPHRSNSAPVISRPNRPPLKDLTRAISNWERGIGCFLKIRIIHQRPLRLAPNGPWLRIEGKRPTQFKKPFGHSCQLVKFVSQVNSAHPVHRVHQQFAPSDLTI